MPQNKGNFVRIPRIIKFPQNRNQKNGKGGVDGVPLYLALKWTSICGGACFPSARCGDRDTKDCCSKPFYHPKPFRREALRAGDVCYLAYPFPWPLCAIVHPFLSGWWRFGGERVCVCYQLRGMREGGFHYASGSPFGIKFRIRGKQSKGSQQHYKPGSAKWKENNLHLHHHRHRYGTDRQGCVLFQGAEQV